MSNHIKSFIVSIIIASPFVCVGQSNLLNAKVPTDIGKLSEVQIASNDNTPVPYRIYKTDLKGFGVDYNVRFVV